MSDSMRDRKCMRKMAILRIDQWETDKNNQQPRLVVYLYVKVRNKYEHEHEHEHKYKPSYLSPNTVYKHNKIEMFSNEINFLGYFGIVM